MLPTSAGVEPVTSWSSVGRRIQLSHRGWLAWFCTSTHWGEHCTNNKNLSKGSGDMERTRKSSGRTDGQMKAISIIPHPLRSWVLKNTLWVFIRSACVRDFLWVSTILSRNKEKHYYFLVVKSAYLELWKYSEGIKYFLLFWHQNISWLLIGITLVRKFQQKTWRYGLLQKKKKKRMDNWNEIFYIYPLIISFTVH